MTNAVTLLIRWLVNRSWGMPTPVVTFDGKPLFERYAPFWPDEWRGRHRPPWWRPFNILLHRWTNGEGDAFHDHPRWSITICLQGKIIEKTPWARRVLTPGSIVFRSRKYIHAFELPEEQSGETWTLFIVGRRNHEQNSYDVRPRGRHGSGLPVPHEDVTPSPSHME